MPQKSLAKPPKPEDPVAAVAVEEAASSTPKKASNEIDEIFGKKRKKSDQEKSEKPKEDGADKEEKPIKKKKKKSKTSKESKSSFPDPAPRPRRRTNDGFTVYSAEELGIGKEDAGDNQILQLSWNLFSCTGLPLFAVPIFGAYLGTECFFSMFANVVCMGCLVVAANHNNQLKII